jgi:hypothetical protein
MVVMVVERHLVAFSAEETGEVALVEVAVQVMAEVVEEAVE